MSLMVGTGFRQGHVPHEVAHEVPHEVWQLIGGGALCVGLLLMFVLGAPVDTLLGTSVAGGYEGGGGT